MSRNHVGFSSGHSCVAFDYCGAKFWRMSWTVDFYYRDSRQRHPRRFTRETEDQKAAMRFCKRWGIEVTPPK